MTVTADIPASYNASPPPDDGTQTEANRVTWAKIKDKIGDPINSRITTLVTAVNGEVFASGTAMVFYNDAAPTGWTADTTVADHAIRIVSATGGVKAGTDAFSTVFGSSKTAAAHTLTGAESGRPAFTVTIPTVDSNATGGTSGFWFGNRTDATDQTISITAASASSGHSHGLTLDIKYADMIVASKD